MSVLEDALYGKENVRLMKVVRDGETHTAIEMTVKIQLRGDIASSYTHADNSVVVATDSMKNTIFIKAKEGTVDPPELFAATLGQHFLDTYSHIHSAHIGIDVHRWTRMTLGEGKEHPYSFLRDGAELRIVEADVSRAKGISLRSGIKGLTVLKTTGSAFHSFVRDEYTTLPEVWDRILSTDVDSTWQWNTFKDLAAVQKDTERFNKAWTAARQIILCTFAEDHSASVQALMYTMSDRILAAVPETAKASFTLPNKHYFEIDLSWHNGIKNTGADAEVYAPQTNPNGTISCTVARK